MKSLILQSCAATLNVIVNSYSVLITAHGHFAAGLWSVICGCRLSGCSWDEWFAAHWRLHSSHIVYKKKGFSGRCACKLHTITHTHARAAAVMTDARRCRHTTGLPLATICYTLWPFTLFDLFHLTRALSLPLTRFCLWSHEPLVDLLSTRHNEVVYGEQLLWFFLYILKLLWDGGVCCASGKQPQHMSIMYWWTHSCSVCEAHVVSRP